MTITHAYDPDDLCFRLYVTSPGQGPMPAGERLFRAPPHPRIAFAHDSGEQAAKDAATLQKYLDGLAPQKRKKKSEDKNAYT